MALARPTERGERMPRHYTTKDFSRRIPNALLARYCRSRSKNCAVEPYRRGELDYFFCSPEDHSQRSIDGAVPLTRQVNSRRSYSGRSFSS